MLGVYDYTVILTYISLWISIGGMMLSLNGHLDLALLYGNEWDCRCSYSYVLCIGRIDPSGMV